MWDPCRMRAWVTELGMGQAFQTFPVSTTLDGCTVSSYPTDGKTEAQAPGHTQPVAEWTGYLVCCQCLSL